MRYFYNTEILSMKECKNDRFIVNTGKSKHALMDKIGRISDNEYYEIRPRRDGYFSASFGWRNELLLDSDGRVICEEAKDIDLFSDDGIAVVEELDGSKRWLTKDGVKFGDQFADIGGFAGGYGSVKLDDGKWVFIDKNMNVVSPSFDGVRPFFNGGKYTCVLQGNEYFIINKQFEILSGPYENIMWFEEENDLFLTSKEDKETNKRFYVYYTPDGQQIGKQYKMVHGFSNGFCRVDDGVKGYNYIDESGKELCKESFMTAGNFGEHFGYVGGFDEKGEHTFAYVRRDGSISENWYPYIGDESEGLLFVMKGSRSYFMNDKEKIMSKGFKRLNGFNEGIASFESSKNKRTYMDRNFVPFSEEFDSTGTFYGGFGVVRQNGNLDAVNKHQLKLSEISKFADAIEKNPIVVMNLPDKILEDSETTFLLCEHAIQVLDYAIQSENYDDISKVQFERDKKLIETLKLKVQSKVPKEKHIAYGDYFGFGF